MGLRDREKTALQRKFGNVVIGSSTKKFESISGCPTGLEFRHANALSTNWENFACQNFNFKPKKGADLR